MTLTAESYFLEVPLYQTFSHQSEDDLEDLIRIQFCVSTLDAFCVGCEQHSVFRSLQELPDLGPGIVRDLAKSLEHLVQSKEAWFPHDDEGGTSMSKQLVASYMRRPKYFTTQFLCSRDQRHDLRFVTRVEAKVFSKVGQHPALAELHLGDLQKYRKILGPDYGELARAVGLFAHGVGIGAFVYLRRIFERMIEVAHQEAALEATWDEAAFQKARMNDRVQLLSGKLPQFVVQHRAVYGIMSKGIHELTEAECLQSFPIVRVAIELMLDEKLASVERAKKIAATASALGAIQSRSK